MSVLWHKRLLCGVSDGNSAMVVYFNVQISIGMQSLQFLCFNRVNSKKNYTISDEL